MDQHFYTGHSVDVAQALLGKLLCRKLDGHLLTGIITETEAYQGESDLGCHAKSGRTNRTEVMYGPPGRAYVYFTYGMHWMLNAVTNPDGFPGAVLIRAVFPLDGITQMQTLRKRPDKLTPHHPEKRWTDGPAKLCQAFGISGRENGINLCAEGVNLYITDGGTAILPDWVENTSRIGLYTVHEPWKSMPWRWRINDLGIENLSTGITQYAF